MDNRKANRLSLTFLYILAILLVLVVIQGTIAKVFVIICSYPLYVSIMENEDEMNR